MRTALRLLAAVVVTVGLLPGTAAATHVPDQSFKMDELFTSPNQATNSDLAFWGNHAFVGYYTADSGFPAGTPPRGGVRIFDVSNPASPRLVQDIRCDGLQADPIVWDRNGNGVADLLLVAVDRTMEAPECGAQRSNTPAGCQVAPEAECAANHADPDGWEGVRVIELSDDPANPFATWKQVAAVYTDCGAHTITLWPGKADKGKLIVYVSSYPLRAGPTCGDTEYQNLANPYDGDRGLPANPLHGVIQVIEVPLANPAASKEIAQPAISYPGDPDDQIDWCERSIVADPDPCPGADREPAAVACHDIVVHVEHQLAGAACAEQGQVWKIGRKGIPDTANPILIADDKVSSGGTGQIPGAVDFFHSVMFNNEGTVVNWVDESFGGGCPTMTPWRARPWHPASVEKTGRMFFTDIGGNFLSEFHVGDVRPDPGETEYCSAHMGMSVPGIKRDLLVNAWYTGGVDVIDFTKPTRLKEIAYYDPQQDSGTWSAYPYTGPLFERGRGIPIYASDGVENNALAEGMVVYRAILPKPGRHVVDHLNPQTMDW